MPSGAIPLGPYSAMYVGDAPPTGGALLTISETRTAGSILRYNIPEAFEDTADSFNGDFVAAGRAELTIDLRFLGISDNGTRLAMGNSITTPSTPDAPGGKTKYTILFLSPNPLDDTSILIPVCKTKRLFQHNREKKAQTESPITLTWQNRNPYKRLFYQDTLANLLALSQMTGRAPL